VDESHVRELASWTAEAREHGLPVALTGFVLFRLALGLGPWVTAALVVLLLVVPVVAACATLPHRDPAPDLW
jgi:hypothetical protein